MRVLLADDHTLVRQALRAMLEDEADIEVVGEAPNGRLAVELTCQLDPEIVLMDVTMPVLNGIQATRAILAQRPLICVIGLSMHEHMDRAMQEAGATAFVNKGDLPDQLLDIMRTCYRHMREDQPPALAA
jgi:DNA-binding NarL/FixJ family response regulator